MLFSTLHSLLKQGNHQQKILAQQLSTLNTKTIHKNRCHFDRKIKI